MGFLKTLFFGVATDKEGSNLIEVSFKKGNATCITKHHNWEGDILRCNALL
jgi:hypothetical protein